MWVAYSAPAVQLHLVKCGIRQLLRRYEQGSVRLNAVCRHAREVRASGINIHVSRAWAGQHGVAHGDSIPASMLIAAGACLHLCGSLLTWLPVQGAARKGQQMKSCPAKAVRTSAVRSASYSKGRSVRQ